MKISYKIFSLLVMVILSSLPMVVLASGPGFGGGVDDGGGGACAAPLDGGISMLIAAGVGYGAKVVAANRKKKAQTANA